jgi:hypothetical protein
VTSFHMDHTEVMITDPKTGAKKGSKPARFDLIPHDALWTLAEHYGHNCVPTRTPVDATEEINRLMEECTCCSLVDTKHGPTATVSVDPAMRKTSEDATQNTPSVNEKTATDGHRITKNTCENKISNTEPHRTLYCSALDKGRSSCVASGCHLQTSVSLQRTAALSAEARPKETATISTTTTPPEISEGSCAANATKRSDCLTTIVEFCAGHAITCPVHNTHYETDAKNKLYRLGKHYPARNWEKGNAWSLHYASLMHHIAAWWMGEDVDPKSEHKALHLTAVAWHALALLAYQLRGIGTDDRAKIL